MPEIRNLQINGPKNKWLLKEGWETGRRGERESEARSCPLETRELRADDLRTSLAAETVIRVCICMWAVSLLETRAVVVLLESP